MKEPPRDLPAGLAKHEYRQRVSSSDPDYWVKKGMIFPKSNERWGGEWTDDMRRRIEGVQIQRKFVLGWYAHNERMLDEGKLPAKWLEYREHMRLSIEMGDDAPMRFLENKALPAVKSADSTKLGNAAVAGDAEELQVLLDQLGIEAGKPDEFGLTPLHKAAMGGHIKAVMVLLAHGADVNARSKFLYAPLHAAAVAGHKAIVWLLLHAGADVSIQDEDEKTALDLAEEYVRFEVVAMLKHYTLWVDHLSQTFQQVLGTPGAAPEASQGYASANQFFESFQPPEASRAPYVTTCAPQVTSPNFTLNTADNNSESGEEIDIDAHGGPSSFADVD